MKRDISFYFVGFLLCVFLSCLSTDYDYDLFARLIVGQRFIEDGILPFKDFLSYTPTHQWYDHWAIWVNYISGVIYVWNYVLCYKNSKIAKTCVSKVFNFYINFLFFIFCFKFCISKMSVV